MATLNISTIDVLGQAVSLPVSITLCDVNKNTVSGYSAAGVSVTSYSGVTNASGFLAVNLIPNSTIQPVNSLYLVDIGGREFLIIKSASTQTLYQALAATPAELTAGVVLQGAAGTGGALGYYGAFQDTTTQTIASTTVAYPITFNTTDESNGVSRGTPTSRIVIGNTGTYNFQWSGQFVNTDSSDHDVDIWVRKNGVDIAGTTGRVSVPARHGAINGHIISGWNFVFSLNANDYIELVWSADSTAVSLATFPAGTSPTRPSTASVVATVTQVMYLQAVNIPEPSVIPLANSGQTLGTALSSVTGGWTVLNNSLWTVPTGKTLQVRLVAVFTGHNSGDILGIDLYDDVSNASVIPEILWTTSTTLADRVSSSWVNVSNVTWRAVARVRNSTAARGVSRQCWLEFKFI